VEVGPIHSDNPFAVDVFKPWLESDGVTDVAR